MKKKSIGFANRLNMGCRRTKGLGPEKREGWRCHSLRGGRAQAERLWAEKLKSFLLDMSLSCLPGYPSFDARQVVVYSGIEFLGGGPGSH